MSLLETVIAWWVALIVILPFTVAISVATLKIVHDIWEDIW
jgi:predicted secreted protein